MKTTNVNLMLYGISIVLTLLIHYYLLSEVVMSSTMHVFLGIVILFLILFVFTVIFGGKSKGGKR